jgi:hypothetical protein
MEGIYETNDNFNFDKLILVKPTQIPGGNYFIKLLINDNSLYIQPPKCKLKQGISKAGKRMFADLMFTNENDQFVRWMENLENHCQKNIFKNREQWFDGDLELSDIENYFTSPLKVYKSGKYYIIRTNIATSLGKSNLKVYDENENEVDMDNINENMNIMTILEIQGIKCSARSFQIDIELKQMLVLNPINIFDKCLLTKKTSEVNTDNSQQIEETKNIIEEQNDFEKKHDNNEVNNNEVNNNEVNNNEVNNNEVNNNEVNNNEVNNNEVNNFLNNIIDDHENDIVFNNNDNKEVINEYVNNNENNLEENEKEIIENKDITIKETIENKSNNGLEEVSIPLEDLSQDDKIQLKQRNEVYYEMYREARRKAKIARNLALTSYLEAKRIKNTYMLDDLKDSDDSDLDIDLEEE